MVLTFRNSLPPRLSLQHDPDPSDVEAVVRKAAHHAGRGEHAQALRAYQLALLMDESQADTWFSYASLQRRMGMLDDAVESFEFALRQDPDLYAARYSLAHLLCDMGRRQAAVEHFRQLVDQRPTYIDAWRHLVQLTWELGNSVGALFYAREGLRNAPHDTELAAMLCAMESPGSNVQRVAERTQG